MAASETVKSVDAFAAPSRATAAGPPAQVQDRAGHADFGVGIKFQTALVKVHAICNSLRDFTHRPYTKVIEAKKQHLSFRGKKLDDDAATLETIGIAPDYTLRTQSVTVSDK